MTPLTAILGGLRPNKGVAILTFPATPDFDSNWDNFDGNVYLWCYKTLRYNEKLLPKMIEILSEDGLPANCEPSLIVAFDQVSYNIGRQLSQILHVPLCLWIHNTALLAKAHYYCFSKIDIQEKCSSVIGPLIEDINDLRQLCNNIHGEIYHPL